MIGKILGGRYKIEEIIGNGGMAEVYKAYCTKLNRYVAIKVLKKEFSCDAEFVERFNLESQAAAGISHSNIVSVYDVGCDDGIHYIVMELVEGITLKDYINTHGMLPWRQALDFSIQICDAMAHAHREGIVHRDIKPQNIMVTSDNMLKVMDFGIARTANKDITTENNTAIGTVHYISPEQARGGYVDERSDIYSMGIVMYEMLTGKVPFDDENAVAIAIKHMQNRPVPPRDIVIVVPYEFEAICLKAMEKNPENRYATTDDLLADLRILDKDTVQTNTDDYEPVENYEIFKTAPEREKNPATDNPKYKKVISKTTPGKDDKRAKIILAAASAAIVLVFVLVFTVAIKPDLFRNTWFGDKIGAGSTELIIDKYPDLVGRRVEDVEKEYKNNKDVKIVVDDDRVESVEYDEGYIVSQTPEAGEKVTARKITIKVVVSKGISEGLTEVPDFTGKHYKEAVKLLDKNDISYKLEYDSSEDYPEGYVISQTPAKGKKLTPGTVVKLYVNKSKKDDDEDKIAVPGIEGFDSSAARTEIEAAGLQWGTVTEQASDKPKGVVISQSPSAGTKVEEGFRINVVLSSGVAPKEEPEEPIEEPGNETGNVGSETTTGTVNSEMKTRYLSINLPQDGRESVNVSVKIGGQVIHEQNYDTVSGVADIRLTSRGTKNVEVYIDGALSDSITLDFDE